MIDSIIMEKNVTLGDCDSFREFDIYQALVLSWYTVIMVLNIFLIIFTMVKARLKAKEMDEAMGSLYDEYDNDGYYENDISDYSMYQKMPEEYSDKRRQSEAASDEVKEEDIDEDDEERDYFPSPSSSIHTENSNNGSIDAQRTPDYFTFRRTSLERQYPRSNSTAECYPSRNSLVPGVKSSLKRTESQNRADYLIKVGTYLISPI